MRLPSALHRFRFIALLCSVLPLAPLSLQAQWQVQSAGTAADLRGVDYVGSGVAWVSGSAGTILHTEDMGRTWQRCTTPPDAAKLDFRGIQGLGKDSALVMSSGKGDLSRLYKTTNNCRSWTLVFTNPDETGFFDALRRVTDNQLFLLGDPVNGKFSLFTSRDAGSTWFIADDPGLEAPAQEGAFAASNSSLLSFGNRLAFGAGGPLATVYHTEPVCDAKTGSCSISWQQAGTPLAHGPASAGVFSLGGHLVAGVSSKSATVVVAVGGAYDKPDDPTGAAALSLDGGTSWSSPGSLPGGYRSAVAYNPGNNTWIAVGPNGTDLSTDDGRNWHPLKPDVRSNDTPDADQHWNALSLPFAVGPKGRIGLRDSPTATP